MNSPRLSNTALAGAVCAAILAGCSAGSQFTPPSGPTGSSATAFQQAAPMHVADRGHGRSVSPDWLDWTGCIIINGKCHYYYINIWNQWIWLTTTVKKSSGGSTLGGSLAKANEFDMATTTGTIAVYTGKTLLTTLTGLKASASGVATDTHGNTFAAVNTTGGVTIEEFASGSKTPTAAYADANLSSVASIGIDQADRLYVEGQSQKGNIEVDELAGSGSFVAVAQPGTIGATAGGLAVQTSNKVTYLWINDLGNASDPANIARYQFDGKSLTKLSSFEYAGTNGAIAVDPTGKDPSHVYAVNNVATGSEYSVSGIEYDYSGNIVSQSSAQSASQQSIGIWAK